MKIIKDTDDLIDCGIVATIGMFDGVHIGHHVLLEALTDTAKKHGLKSAVVTFREHPQLVLNHKSDLKMILPLEKRLKYIADAGVDFVIVMNFSLSLAVLDSFEFMRLLRNKYKMEALVVGYNHSFGHNTKATLKEYLHNGATLGVQIIKAPEYNGPHCPVSSSVIRKLLATGKVDDAMDCLGRPYSLQGTVGHGQQNGRELGFPTANMENIDPMLLIPHRGAYAVKITLEDGSRLDGMANIGIRPTIDSNGNQTIEVHIFDFDRDIYGQAITIDFIRFIRTELKMDSIDELKSQLSADELLSRNILYKIK